MTNTVAENITFHGSSTSKCLCCIFNVHIGVHIISLNQPVYFPPRKYFILFHVNVTLYIFKESQKNSLP